MQVIINNDSWSLCHYFCINTFVSAVNEHKYHDVYKIGKKYSSNSRPFPLFTELPSSITKCLLVVVRSTQSPAHIFMSSFSTETLTQFSHLCLYNPFGPCSFTLRITVSDLFIFPTWSLISTTHFINLDFLALTNEIKGQIVNLLNIFRV